MDIEDTFAFMENRHRRRVESDASSFYFRAPSSHQYGQSFTRGHRHRDSTMSFSSQGPPISLYNRSFSTHRRNDSSASSSSVAMSMQGMVLTVEWQLGHAIAKKCLLIPS